MTIEEKANVKKAVKEWEKILREVNNQLKLQSTLVNLKRDSVIKMANIMVIMLQGLYQELSRKEGN
jgi:hypothetical protein